VDAPPTFLSTLPLASQLSIVAARLRALDISVLPKAQTRFAAVRPFFATPAI